MNTNPVVRVKRSLVEGKVPTTGQLGLGELAINHYDGKLFIRQDTAGVGIATTVITLGQQGPQGPTGAQGTAGAQGFQGPQGSTGAQGAQGFQGPQGSTGAQGSQGAYGPIAGSANQIVYKDGSNNPTGSGNLTFDGSNLYIGGNVTIGGTTVLIAASTLTIKDKDIVVGIATTTGGVDISNDTSASHGGIAVASTEGSPLVPFGYGSPINDLPDTYKQIMWVKSGAWAGLNTDAWLFNYGVGIGSTQVPYGVRLAAGGMQVTDTTVTTPNLNVTGLSTLTALSVSGSTGTYGQYLKSTITGLVWSSFTPLRNTYNYSAAEDQKQFSAAGISSGYVDVFLNGIRLDDTNYSVVGTGISLGVGAFNNDEITIVGYSTTTASNSDTAGYSPWNKYYTGVSTSSNVGIGTTVPTQNLQVQGNVRIVGGIYDSNNSIGTAGLILVSTGAGISWTTPNSISNLVSITGTTSTYTATSIDDYIGVSATVPVTITLPSSPPKGKQIVIKDEGNKIATYSITVNVGVGVSIENNSSVIMNINHQSLTCMFNGSNWFII